MKNVIISILALFIFSSSQAQDKVRYTQQAPEIETIKAYYKAYSDADWKTFTAFYDEGATITHNDSGDLNPRALLESLKYHADYCSTFGINVSEEELERVITDKKEIWVNAWGTWEGTVKATGEKISFPVHSTFQFKDGKIVEQHAYYDGNQLGAAVAGVNTKNNTSIVQGMYDSFKKGDVGAVMAVIDAEVVWNEADHHPLAGGNPYIGPDAVLNGVFMSMGNEYEYYHTKDIEVHAMADDQVLATLRYDAKLKKNGALLDAQSAHHWTLKDGKVVAFQQYTDTKAFDKAISKTTQPPIHFIEMWTATDAWKNLSQKERGEYMAALASPIQSLMEQGVEIISWGANEADTDQRADYDFYAVWSFPNAEIKRGFEQAVEGSGWYKYFEQKNVAGKNVGIEAVMGTLIGM